MKEGITLLILAKNEEHQIHLPINSMKDIASEIIVINDHSIDNMTKVAQRLGAKVIPLPFHTYEKGFAEAVNFGISQCRTEWAILLDSDELLSNPEQLHPLTRHPNIHAWKLPRRKWLNYKNNLRTEFESYPDWQPKFWRVEKKPRFEGEMHIQYKGPKAHFAYNGSVIEHLHEECRDDNKTRHRNELYVKLAQAQGVSIIGGAPLERNI